MKYRVIYTQEVVNAIEAQVAYFIGEQAPSDRIESWLAGLYDCMIFLDQWPRRFPIAEAISRAKGYEVRRMNYGQCAIFYRVDDGRSVVELLAFRHGRRRPWSEETGMEGR